MKQNEELRRKVHFDNSGFHDNVNTQDEISGIQVKEWKNKMDKLWRDVMALDPKSRDMDWLFCSNNPLAFEMATVNLSREF